ncbi:MAG: DUF4350 domain-containing protein [Woeseiaceae bacterium]|nr:DUF4350 domain-containing protein [Woeseiaceae bacterium]
MRQTTLVLLIILAATLVASWWFSSFERTTRQEYVGLGGEARYNDYFAAEALLEEVGIEADGIATLSPDTWLPPTADTLVLSLDEVMLVEAVALDTWVHSGGHLVITPGREKGSLERYLGGALPAEYVTVEFEIEFQDVTAAAEAASEASEGDAYADENIEDDDYVWWGDTRIELVDASAAVATMEDDYGITVARLLRGEGIVTILSADRMFRNLQLTETENARLLLDIVDGYYEPGKVWFVYSNSFDSLIVYIVKALPFTVLALVLALALWLLSILPRFGPPISPTVRERRSLIEHIASAGPFEWKHAEREALASCSIGLLMHTAERRHPGIGRLPLKEQATRLASITGLPEQDIADALATLDGHTPKGFTKHMQILQKTRDRL